ncbi:MAG: hypothetical protein ACT4P9_05190 [Betaproteobacteria bacterium]
MNLNQLAAKAIVLMSATAFGVTAYSQARHDEKPHGPSRKAVQKSEIKQPRGGPRHDEKPHGAPERISADKKSQAK